METELGRCSQQKVLDHQSTYRFDFQKLIFQLKNSSEVNKKEKYL